MKDLILQFVNDDSREEDILVVLKTVLQLLGNLCVNNERNQSLLWEICFPEVFVLVCEHFFLSSFILSSFLR